MSLAQTLAPARSRRPTGDRSGSARLLSFALAAILLLVALLSVASGPSGFMPRSALHILLDALSGGLPAASAATDALVVLEIRLPRTILGILVGAALAVSGLVMQGLFRNPLADPGLVGVSAGAALAAVTATVLGGAWAATVYALPAAAFLGGLATTFLLYGIATRNGRTSVATMLLAGIAIAALAGAATGLLVFISDDRQLRDFTFWSLGSLAGASWEKVAVAGAFLLLVAAQMPRLAHGLDGLLLGEAEARHLGIAVQGLKRRAIFAVAAAVGASVAVAGPIGFVGIVVPHLLRLVIGPCHRGLMPACALAGGILLVGADMAARSIAAPAELPIGIVTALIGAPFFLWLLLRQRAILDL